MLNKRIVRQAARSWIELTRGLRSTDNDTPEYAFLFSAESLLHDWLTNLPDDHKDDLRERFHIEI